LEELIKTVHKDHKDKFNDNELKDKILASVKHEENYPLKLLRDVFQDVNVRMRYENKEDIKRTLDEKINMRRDVEKILGVSVVLGGVFGAASVFGEALAHLSPVLLAAGILTGELVRSIKDIIEEKAKKNPFNKIIVLKKYWDSLNESERKMLCYKLDSSQHLVPGESEKYLRIVFGDELRDLEKKVEEVWTYAQRLEEFQKKLEEFEKENKDILSKLAELNEGIKEFNNEFKLALDELRKSVEELRENVKWLKNEIPSKVVTADRAEFEEASFYKNVKVEDGKLRISVRSEEEYRDVVIASGFRELVNDVANALRDFGVVVITGPKGIGKSVLGATVVWELLRSGYTDLTVGVKELDSDYVFSTFNALVSNIKKLGHPLLVVFDPSTTYAYREVSGVRDVSKNIKTTLENLFISIKPGEQEMLLIILPTEMYKPVDQLVRKDLGGSVKDLDKVIKEIKLNDKEFLAGVIREYLGECQIGDEKLSELAGKVAGFDSGYTLIARFVGEELARNCNVDRINELIDKSRGKAEEFILGHINSFFEVVDDNRVRALIEIFALRRQFVSWNAPESPILTPGIVEIIRSANDPEQMKQEMINWLVYRHHDLIEDTIERLLNGEDLGEASKPWRRLVIRTNMPKITNEDEAVKYFRKKYGEKFVEELSNFSDCWKKAALIIGCALTMHLKLPDKEDVPSDSEVVDALNPCDIDDYLLVNNKIPYFVYDLVTPLYISDSSPFARIFTNEYENAIEEAKKLLEIWRRKFNEFEAYYALGLTLIVAEAARLGKAINEDDANAILKVVIPTSRLVTLHKRVHSFSKFLQEVKAFTSLVAEPFNVFSSYILLQTADSCTVDLLRALEPLRDKAPQQYLSILDNASTKQYLEIQFKASQRKLNKDTVRLIYDELNYILSNFFNRLIELGWPLATAMATYSLILHWHFYFTDEEVEDIVKSMCNLLNALKKESNELATIAETFILTPALMHPKLRNSISEYCSVKDLVARADEVRESIRELANKSDELLKNKYFMNWATVVPRISQQDIREIITSIEGLLILSLAEYKLKNDELDEASKLSNEATEIYKSIKERDGYIVARNWFLRAGIVSSFVITLDLQAISKVLQEIEKNLKEWKTKMPKLRK